MRNARKGEEQGKVHVETKKKAHFRQFFPFFAKRNWINFVNATLLGRALRKLQRKQKNGLVSIVLVFIITCGNTIAL